MHSFTDDIVINGIRSRDDAVFKYIQVKFQDSIRLMVMEMGGSPEDAQDVFNEGLIALIRLVDMDDFQLTCKLGTLMYALCKKRWKQQLEKRIAARNYHVRKQDTEPDIDFTEDYDFELYRSVFWETFEKLDDPCKKILQGYLKDFSPREISENLGFSYSYVRKKKSLCHSYLMRMIEKHPDYIKIKETEQMAVVE